MTLCCSRRRAVNKRTCPHCVGHTTTTKATRIHEDASATTNKNQRRRRRRSAWPPSICDGRIDSRPTEVYIDVRPPQSAEPPTRAATNSPAYCISSTRQLTAGKAVPLNEGKWGRPERRQRRRAAAWLYLATQISGVHGPCWTGPLPVSFCVRLGFVGKKWTRIFDDWSSEVTQCILYSAH